MRLRRLLRMTCSYRLTTVLAGFITLATIFIVYWYQTEIQQRPIIPDGELLAYLFKHNQDVQQMRDGKKRTFPDRSRTSVHLRRRTRNRTFYISDWSFYNRHLKRGDDYFVDNCIVRRTSDHIAEADVVAVAIGYDHKRFPAARFRNPKQRWVFLFDDTMANFEPMRCLRPAHYNGVFNWTMTYRRDSDIHIPYGYTVPLVNSVHDAVPPRKTALVFAMISNCVVYFNNRLEYIAELKQHMKVDFYGACGDLHCDGHLEVVDLCADLKRYKFVLAFENTNCQDYITEKFWRTLNSSIVPVVMGAKKEDYQRMAPPGSFIHVDDFRTPQKLAEYLQYLDQNDDAYNSYLEWRKHYRVVFRIQFMHNTIWTALCDKLNEDNGEVKVYEDFEKWVDVYEKCPNLVDRYLCGH